jgi:SET domain-containing protein
MRQKGIVIKRSAIHHQGVFAARDFHKGEVVMTWSIDKILTQAELKDVSAEDEKYISYMGKGKYVIMCEPSRFVNHSCDANTKAVNGVDVARLDIMKCEEITANYSEEKAPHRFTCNCGSTRCKNIIGKNDAVRAFRKTTKQAIK